MVVLLINLLFNIYLSTHQAGAGDTEVNEAVIFPGLTECDKLQEIFVSKNSTDKEQNKTKKTTQGAPGWPSH